MVFSPKFQALRDKKVAGLLTLRERRLCYQRKFKSLKTDLKKWNKQTFGTMDNNIESHGKELQRLLDMLDDTVGLEESEISRRNEVSVMLFRDLKLKGSLLA